MSLKTTTVLKIETKNNLNQNQVGIRAFIKKMKMKYSVDLSQR